MWSFWLIAAGIFFAIEIVTVGFLIFWLGCGALLAMVVSFFTNNLIIQGIVFVVSSTILILLTKPLVNKYVNSKPLKPTNTYSLIGQHGIVIMDINPTDSTGQVKVNSEIWSAKSDTETLIPKGTDVKILQIDGVKLVVSPLKYSSY